jgi:hypothetical protein
MCRVDFGVVMVLGELFWSVCPARSSRGTFTGSVVAGQVVRFSAMQNFLSLFILHKPQLCNAGWTASLAYWQDLQDLVHLVGDVFWWKKQMANLL